MMLNYRLKFKKLPRQMKKNKQIKIGTEYTLFEADNLYKEVIQSIEDKVALSKEKISFDIISKEDGDILSFKLQAYNMEAPTLQDAVAFDFSQSKMKLGDDPKEKEILKRTIEIEESMMSEFNQIDVEPEELEQQDSSSIDNQKENDSIIRKQEEEQAYLEQLEAQKKQQEAIENDGDEIDEAPIPLQEEHSIEDSLYEEEKIEEPQEVPTRQSRHTMVKEESLLDKQAFVSIDNPDIKQKVKALENQLLETQSKGVSFILSHLTYLPSDNDFIRKAKQAFVTENYSDEPILNRTRIHQKRVNEMYSDSSDTLQQFYEQETNKGYEQKLEQDHQQLIASIKNEYQVKSPALKNEKEKQYQLALEAMENRHKQEQESLSQQQLSEKQSLKSECQMNLQDEKQALEKELNQRYTVDWESIQINDKNDWVRHTNDNLTIGKQNVEQQVLDKMNQFEIEDSDFYQQWIQHWQQKVDAHQEEFQQAYRQYEEERQAKEAKEKEDEEAKRAERQLALEENKVAVQKEELNQQLKQKDYEIQSLKSELEKKEQDYKQSQVEAKQRENELMRTITESNQMQQAFHQESQSTQPKPEVYSKAQVKKWVFGGVAGTMLAIGMIGFGVKTHYDNVAESEAQAQAQKLQEKKQTQLEKDLKENQEALKSLQSEKDKLSDQQKDTKKALEEANKKLKEAEKKKDDKKESKQ